MTIISFFLHLIFLFDILQVYPCPGLRTRPTSNNNPDLPIRLLFRGFFFLKKLSLNYFSHCSQNAQQKNLQRKILCCLLVQGNSSAWRQEHEEPGSLVILCPQAGKERSLGWFLSTLLYVQPKTQPIKLCLFLIFHNFPS